MDHYRIAPATNGVDRPETPDEKLPASGDRLRAIVLAALTVGLIVLCIAISVPFLPALTWGIALAIVAWPMHAWLSRYITHRDVAAVLSTVAVVVVVMVPGLFVAYQLVREAGAAAQQVRTQSVNGGLRNQIDQAPVVGPAVTWIERTGVDVEYKTRQIVANYTEDLSGLVQGSLQGGLQFLITVFVLFYLFRDRRQLMEGLRALLPMSRGECERVFTRAADSVHANLYATMVTAALSGVAFGTLFWLLGLPAPMLWGLVMFVLAVLPIVGTGLVWVPAAGYLLFTERWGAAAILIAFGLLWFVLVDNLLYIRLVGGRLRLHPVPAMIAFLGGLAVFGVSGMILGPVIVAVTVALLEVWKHRLDGVQSVVEPESADTLYVDRVESQG